MLEIVQTATYIIQFPIFAGEGSITIERFYRSSSSDLHANNPKVVLIVNTRGGPITFFSWRFNGNASDFPTTVDLNREADSILRQSKFQVKMVTYGYKPGTYTFRARNRAMTDAVTRDLIIGGNYS